MKIEKAKYLLCEARGMLRGVAAMVEEGYEDVLRDITAVLDCAMTALEDEETSDA